ncbi:trypsin-like serine peptidase [Methylotetracoccus oryzae]|uniref:trypsin-like serine peptidase n=1 Tax=Methylotetracoccus oryzae TaxID=1919059 RepID=UPI0019122B0E|nr:trypsin-like serine protease [Methylotetracoccus oryzae]
MFKANLQCACLSLLVGLFADRAGAAGMTAERLSPRGDGRMTVRDYANARAMPLPGADARSGMAVPSARRAAGNLNPGSSTGSAGDGKTVPEVIVPRHRLQVSQRNDAEGGIEPQAFGHAGQPFTTSRVDLRGNPVSRFHPYSETGRLFVKVAGQTLYCSAALIKRGLVVTAAHCVAKFGRGQAFDTIRFVPAYLRGVAPFGTWRAKQVLVPKAYLDGSDACVAHSPGVICESDMAVITLTAKPGSLCTDDYAGDHAGWYRIGWDGYGFTDENQALISQFGYPLSHDDGQMMQRTDSQGYINFLLADNTVIGSRQTNGASGGPLLVNFGRVAVLSGTTRGADAAPNTVVGVTSWGYTDRTLKQMGASPFLSTNIKLLVDAACAATPAACGSC